MRKISISAAKAFKNGYVYRSSNTRVLAYPETELYLHGYKIAWKGKDARVYFSLCGWATRTTMERLNTLLYYYGVTAKLHTKKGIVYFGEHEIDSDGIYSIYPFRRSECI